MGGSDNRERRPWREAWIHPAAALSTLTIVVCCSAIASAAAGTPPPNDEAERAQVLKGALPLHFSGTTTNATGSGDDPSDHNVWYSWTSNGAGRFRAIDCDPAELRVKIYRSSSPSPASGRPAPCNFFEEGGLASRSFTIERGDRVLIEISTPEVDGPFSLGIDWDDSTPGGRGDLPVKAVATKPDQQTRIRRLPISSRPGSEPRSVASLPIERLGRLDGGRLEVGGELQLTVCLKPRSAFRSKRGDCAGRLYGYDPHISAYLALASSRGASSPKRVLPLTSRQRLTCTQRQPNRNHHCVIAIPRDGIELPSDAASRCASRPGCSINLIAAAHHRGARRGESVIVGGIDKSGRIDNKGKSRIFAAHFKSGVDADKRPISGRRSRSRLAVAAEGEAARMKVVYSRRIADPQPGEVLLVDGRYLGQIDSLPYNTRTRTAIVLADNRDSARHSDVRATFAAATTTRIAEESNFNCTQGPSGHRSPCPIIEQGVVTFGRNVGKPLYVNLIAGHGAIGAGAERHHARRHRVRVARGGYLKVRRFGP